MELNDKRWQEFDMAQFLPQSTDVRELLEDGEVGVTETRKESGTADACRSTSDQRHRSAVPIANSVQIEIRITDLWDPHLHESLSN